jgi:hypothetical protein
MGYLCDGMLDLLKLLGGFLVGLFRSPAAREAEVAFLRQQLHRRLSRTYQLTHGLKCRIRHPDRGQLPSATWQGLTASRRLVFTRSRGRCGVSDGATTTHSYPSAVISRYSP